MNKEAAPKITTLRFTISGTYNITQEEMEKNYLTTDPDEAARIDESNLIDDPAGLLHKATDFEVSVIGLSDEYYK